MGRSGMTRRCGCVVVVACASVAAQPGNGQAQLSEGVRARLEAAYLSEAERKDLRIFHGVETASDRDTPARAARAALLRGVIDHPALRDASADPHDVAEAMYLRGECEDAIDVLTGERTVRASRIRAEALVQLGRVEEAREELGRLASRLSSERLSSASEMTEAARALMLRARVSGQERGGGQDYQVIMRLLSEARERLDQMHWPAMLAEAELLHEKDNVEQCRQALAEAMSMTGESAWTRELLGRIMVGAFDFAAVEAIASELDAMRNGMGMEGTSPMGDLLVARARLRQNDPEGAGEAVERVLSRFPAMREALALRAATAAEANDFERADALLREYDIVSPGSPDAYFAVGETVAENRQYEEAARYLGEAARRNPHWAQPVIELGLLEIQSGRDDLARVALERAVALDPFNVRARNSLALLDRLAGHLTVESEHFVVRYAPGMDGVLAPEMLPVLERIHRRVAGPEGIDHEPGRRTLIELMPDHASFAVRIAGMPRIHTIAASTGPVIAMESPQDGPGHTVGPYDWARVIQHEYGHTVTLSRTRNRIPHWFTEAAAVYLEDSPRDYGWCEILARAERDGSLFDLAEISFKFVRPETPTDRTQAYAQGHWMYEFMVERWGGRAPLELMDLYAAGVREGEAFRRVLGMEPEAFMDEFRSWAHGELIEWGMLPPEGVPTLEELRREASEAGRGSPGAPSATREQIDRWLALYPDHPEVLREAVARAMEDTDRRLDEETIELLRQYAAARPVDPLPHQRLARHYLAIGEPALAAPHLEYLDAREQHSAAYAVELARLYAARGDLERASAKAERATIIAPFVPSHRELAATVALMRGDAPTAERHLQALTVIEPDRDIHRRRLEALRARGGG